MPEPLQSNRIETPAARLAVREFCAEAVRRAGGIDALRAVLAELGFAGRADGEGEEYHRKSVEAWVGGRRMPSAAVVIALALYFRIPIDGITAAAEQVYVEALRIATATVGRAS